MPKRKLIHRQKAPDEETAKRMADKEFLLMPDICRISGVDEELTLAMIKQFGIKPYILETKKGETVNGYMTLKLKKMFAARGRVVPGFNDDYASQRQWLEILESAVSKPLEKDWYFQPVNPDPLVIIGDEKAESILQKIREYVKYEGAPAETLRLIADFINVESREDLPLRTNTGYKGLGAGLFGLRRR